MKKILHITLISIAAIISAITVSSCAEDYVYGTGDPMYNNGYVRFTDQDLVGRWALITFNDKPVPEYDSFDLRFNSDLISGVWQEMSGPAAVFQWYTESGRTEAARFLYLNFTDGSSEYYLARLYFDGANWFLQLTDMTTTNVLVLQAY
ncbi:MAG: hypothetical protein K2M94_07125 [Paramuribaculum sp.]|nr:hypothetical protein [Paramuribaculum sp.]